MKRLAICLICIMGLQAPEAQTLSPEQAEVWAGGKAYSAYVEKRAWRRSDSGWKIIGSMCGPLDRTND